MKDDRLTKNDYLKVAIVVLTIVTLFLNVLILNQ